eukprot:jgi/Astpho2/3607/e_gw1.00058.42.1_t
MTVDRQEESSVRIATWNINGLRACLRRPGCDHMRSMRQLLDFLDADIVCFQETKMVRQELSPDLGQVEGCFTDHELAEIDQEGRCVCTDHGCFVVFNLYVPAITTEDKAAERFAFKLRLLEALQLRMEASQAAGKAVFLIGDLNISPFPLDSCDPGDSAAFVERRDRQSEAYSCWSTASSARVNNYGARIDFILLGPPKAHCAADDARDKAHAKPPLCSGHKEPCVIREVKKKGPNKGVMLSRCSCCPNEGTEPSVQ